MLIAKIIRPVVIFCLVYGFISIDVSAADRLRLEADLILPDNGRLKVKVQIRGPEGLSGPGPVEDGTRLGEDIVRGGFKPAAPVAPGGKRGTYEIVDMAPLVFVQVAGHPRYCLVTGAAKGAFVLEDLLSGKYKLTFTIPGLGYMEKWVELSPDSTDSSGALKLEINFESHGAIIKPVSRKSISEEASAAFELGVQEFSRNNLESASVSFSKAVEENDHYAEAWEYLGIIERKEDNLEKAEAYFRKTLQIDPNSYWALQYLGTILMMKDDLDAASDLFERAVLLRPGDPYPRTQLGSILCRQQNLYEALDHLVKARVLDPRHFSQPQIITAEVFRVLKDREGVAAELGDFVEHFPDDPKVPAILRFLDSIPWQ